MCDSDRTDERPSRQIRHVIWDWNGTLLDDTQAGVNAVNGMLRTRGLPLLDVARYRDIFGFPVRHFYEAVGFQLEREDWDAMAREFHDLFLAEHDLRLHREATNALQHFSAAGVGQSILSASEQTILERMLATFGIQHHFTHICGVDNLYGQSKLDAETIVRNSSLNWTVFRLAAIMKNHKISKLMFHMPLDTKLEICTPEDTARAFLHAIFKSALLRGRVFNLGGGESCCMTYREFREK